VRDEIPPQRKQKPYTRKKKLLYPSFAASLLSSALISAFFGLQKKDLHFTSSFCWHRFDFWIDFVFSPLHFAGIRLIFGSISAFHLFILLAF